MNPIVDASDEEKHTRVSFVTLSFGFVAINATQDCKACHHEKCIPNSCKVFRSVRTKCCQVGGAGDENVKQMYDISTNNTFRSRCSWHGMS